MQQKQSLQQMHLMLRHKAVTSVLVGASSVSQVEDNVATLNNLEFADEELVGIDTILAA